MSTQWRRLDPRAKRLWRVTALAAVVVVAVPALTAAGVVGGRAALVAATLLAAVVLVLALVLVDRRWHSWGYAERDADLLVRRGLLVRRLSVVPYGRMQFVDVTQGPLERAVGLATVRLHTAAAATDATIRGLDEAEAHRLRDRLAELGEARAAGL
jgi:membrane protein YdbS with pleckstrin-like domain